MKNAINQFLENVDKKILYRGEEYYAVGNVIEVIEERKGYFVAEVQGSEDNPYRVSVQIKDGEVSSYSCNCPYYDDVCKHVIAVLYAIESDSDVFVPFEEEKDLKSMLLKKSKDSLVEFLMARSQHDRLLKSDLFILIGKPNIRADMATAKKLLFNVERTIEYAELDGYESADNVYDAVDEAFDFAVSRINSNVILPAYTIFSELLRQLAEVNKFLSVEYVDDIKQACIEYLLDVLEALKTQCTKEEKNKISSEILTIIENMKYSLTEEEEQAFQEALNPFQK